MLILTRRTFLEFSGSSLLAAAASPPVNARVSLASTPFTLGVASGDPEPDGVVLWTRLAAAPLDEAGGMPEERIPVQWEVARDDRFGRVVRKGELLASPADAHAVHVEVSGLDSGTHYWYRFRAAGWESPVGRTRTAPPRSRADRIRLAAVSCQRWEQGYFTAYRHLAGEDVDLVFHLGDYIYEYETPEKAVRPIEGPETVTLADYRRRYAQYKSDPDLQAAHAAAAFVVTWDDHEVDNDYAGGHAEDGAPPERFLARRAAAYRAYYEHMPLRRRQHPDGPGLPLHRAVRYGALAEFLVLDTRQYRTPQPCGAPRAALCEGTRDPAATILGAAQRTWLFDRLDRSTAAWNVLAQQVLMAAIDVAPGEPREYAMDKWVAYQSDRQAVLDFLGRRRPSNPVVLTGDIHSSWVCDLGPDGLRPEAARVGTEFVCSSISSGGDGLDMPERVAAFLPDNPHVRFFNGKRGYVSCTVTQDRWQSDYRAVPYVTRPGAPIETKASFVVESGRPGALRT